MRYLIAFFFYLSLSSVAIAAEYCGAIPSRPNSVYIPGGYLAIGGNGASVLLGPTTVYPDTGGVGWGSWCSASEFWTNSGSTDIYKYSSYSNGRYHALVRYYPSVLYENGAAPDTDSDGVQDPWDACPTQGGVVDSSGCPSEPSTCTDGLLTVGEMGIDCGGDCSAPCNNYCPDGYTLYTYGEGVQIKTCEKRDDPDKFNNCPSGFSLQSMTDGTQKCVDSISPVIAADVPSTEVQTANGWYQLPASFQPGNFSVAEFTGPTSVVDNGDGTQTATTVTTSSSTSPTGSAPATSTTTRTVVTNISTGAVISDQTTTETEGPFEENPGNYKWSVDDPGSTGDIPDGIVPTENPFSDFLDSTISSNPGSTIINSSGLETSSPVCSLSGVVMGQSLTIDFCRPLISDALEMMGAVLVSICYLLAIFIVFA